MPWDQFAQMIIEDLPAILCLIIGFGLVVVEMYVPGFGLPGISGLVLLAIGVYLKADNASEALVIIIVTIALLCVALSISIHSASKGRLAKSKLVQHEVATHVETLNETDISFFVGKDGLTKTVLRPAGIGEFEGVKLNIVSDGEFIPAGAKVHVERVEGNRIVVREIKSVET